VASSGFYPFEKLNRRRRTTVDMPFRLVWNETAHTERSPVQWQSGSDAQLFIIDLERHDNDEQTYNLIVLRNGEQTYKADGYQSLESAKARAKQIF
jgi:hypothetical protein